MAKKTGQNFLDFVPAHMPGIDWTADGSGKVTIHVPHTGFYDRIAQRFFRRPPVTHIDLDGEGSFVWRQIDGKRTVGRIAELVREEFGEKAEPLYDRLVHYMRILYGNRLIRYETEEKNKR